MLYKTENMIEMEGSHHKHMIKNEPGNTKATTMFRMDSNIMQFSEARSLQSIMQGPISQSTDAPDI